MEKPTKYNSQTYRECYNASTKPKNKGHQRRASRGNVSKRTTDLFE